ncbi:MAG: Smr/MutS family protein [Flavobacteriaceae bacterium]|nr:DNA mismatch repair protein MutS [Psychroflexus sp.]
MKTGDLVELIDDAMVAKIVKAYPDTFLIESEDGFQMEVAKTDVVPQLNYLDIDFSAADVQQKIKDDLSPKNKKSKKVLRDVPVIEVDLHIHNLTDSTRRMSNYDMLDLQLKTAKQRIEYAIKHRHKKVVFIHGVGEGVLKAELETLFRRYDQITHYDANYQTYGVGATEIYIYDN